VVDAGPSVKRTQFDPDDALKTAIKVAVDVGDLVRATALIEVLKNTTTPAPVTLLADARARREREDGGGE
jgi:hypothetical protein